MLLVHATLTFQPSTKCLNQQFLYHCHSKHDDFSLEFLCVLLAFSLLCPVCTAIYFSDSCFPYCVWDNALALLLTFHSIKLKIMKIGNYGDIPVSGDSFSFIARLNTRRPAGPVLLNDIHRV